MSNVSVKNASRIGSLEFLRILATFGILFYHFQQVFGFVPSGFLNLYNSNFNASYLVEFFFVLSGFFALKDADRLKTDLSLPDYVSKKIKRLLPVIFLPCITYTFICYLYRSFIGNSGWYFDTVVDIPGTLCAVLGIQFWGIFDTNPIDYPIWFVDVLLLCYIVMAIINRIARRIKTNPVYGYVFMVFLGTVLWNLYVEIPFFTMFISRGYTAFFFGLLLGIFYNKDTDCKTDKWPTILGYMLIAVFSFLFVNYKIEWFIGYDKYIYTFITYPALIMAFLSRPVQKIFDFAFISSFGKMTYDIFAWHLVVYFAEALLRDCGVIAFETSYITMFASTMIAIAIGVLSYFFVDKAVLVIFAFTKKIFR